MFKDLNISINDKKKSVKKLIYTSLEKYRNTFLKFSFYSKVFI